MGWLSTLKKRLSEEKTPEFRPKGPPSPEFLGVFLVYHFLQKDHFGLKEDQFKEFAAELPEELKGLTKVWTLYYLSWVYKIYAESKYGHEFTHQLLKKAVEEFEKAESLQNGLEGLGNTFSFWLSQLDDSTSHTGTKVEGMEVPFEAFAAMTFLALDESSPYYKSPETNGVELDVAIAFASAKIAALPLIQGSVNIGSPVEEISS